MKLSVPCISIHAPVDELAACIEQSAHGLLLVKDVPTAPFEPILELLQHSSSVADRLNNAYPKNLVYKDSFAKGNGGPKVDLKRVLDLSPERLAVIAETEPNLTKATQLETPLAFWKQWQDVVGRCILPALAQAIGSSDILNDVAYNYRMVDYYPCDDIDKTNHDDASIAPRCGEHRDFGSFTMIQANQPGLQVYVENEWHALDAIPEGSALMVFGWCTQIRSNGRIPAVLHRVEQDQQEHANHRRLAVVLFCAPKMVDTALEPVVRPGEVRKYISGVKVGQLRGQMARKWQKREGTLTKEAYILEEAEIMATPQLQTQDDVIERTVKVL